LSSQLSVVSIALLIEPFELDNVKSCFCKLLGVVLHPLSDGAGEPEGRGANGGIECWIKGEDGLSRCGGDRWVILLGDVADKVEWEGGSC